MSFKGMVNKGKSLIVTVWFMSLITTNAQPKMWQIALIGILMYEAILMFIETWQRATRKRIKSRNIAAGREDMRRVKNALIGWEMREVN